MSIQTSEQIERERLRAEVERLRTLTDAAIARAVDVWFESATDADGMLTAPSNDQFQRRMRAAIDAAMREQAMQALADQAQELGMGYGERK